MTKLNKKVSIFIALIIIFIFWAPARAFELTVDPVQTSYPSGESVTVSTDDYADSGGFNWSLTDWENNTNALDGDRNAITFTLPENNTGATATAVVEAVYGSESDSMAFSIEPVETAAAESLPIVELYPANGATEVLLDTEIYIRFNKPVNIETNLPPYMTPAHIGIGGFLYLLESNADGTVWSLAPSSANLEAAQTYSVSSLMTISDPETGDILYDANQPCLYPSFPAWEFTMAELEDTTPVGITVTDYPLRLQVDQSYPLQAVVKNKKGDILEDFPVDWEVVSIYSGQATVDAVGNLTGDEPGTLNLYARPQGFPDVSSSGMSVEIRQNFDRHLLGVWATELTDREHFYKEAPLVGEDGTIYLTTGGTNRTVRAYDSDGNIKTNFQEMNNLSSYPVLEKIGGREYLLATRDKKMSAFDPVTGYLEWQAQAVEYPLVGRAVVDPEGNIYAGCQDDGKVYAFNLDSDRYLWSEYVQYGNLNTGYGDRGSLLTPGPGNLIYAAGENRVTCLDSGGVVRWQYTVPTPGHSIPVGAEVDSAGNVYFLQEVDVGTFNIYSLDPGGEHRWHVSLTDSNVRNLFVDQDDSLYVTINDKVAGTATLTRLNRADGSVDKEFDVYDCDRFMRNSDGYIYTNKFIFNDNLEVVGYTDLEAVGYADDYYRDLPYMHYSQLALCPDGTLVRSVASAGSAVALEKVTLVGTAGVEPAEIEVEESEITLIQGGTRDIFAQIKDNRGYLLSHLALTYETADENVATVNEAGKITAVGAGETEITVRVQDHEDVSATITLHVLPPQEVTDIYFVPQHTNKDQINLEEKITSFTGVVGEGRTVALVVLDQRGEVIQNLPIKWTLSDSSVVQMYNYTGGVMGSISKSVAVLNGLKEGTAILKAELEDYTGFSAELTVHIEPAPYEILWTLPIEGDWNDKIAYHTQVEDGTLFIANKKKLKAVSSAGDILWEQDISDKYGFLPATPVVDDSNVYVYDLSGFNLSLVALDQQDGSLCWSFTRGRGSVEQVRAGAGGVYLLTGGGKLYGLDRDSGRSLWDASLNLGGDDVTLGLSGDGELYYTRADQVFQVAEDGSAGPLYTAEAGATLAIKEIAPDGRLILEKTAGDRYSIISVDPAGTKYWEVPVETAVELSCDAGGTVYAVTKIKNDVNPHLYFITAGGTLQVDRTISTHRFKTIGQYQIYYKPLIGSDGIVYLPLCRLYAVNAADGQLLWQGEFKDGFFNRVPRTATLDDHNVVYLACDDTGFLALKSKVAGVANESGFYIDTSDAGSLRGNTYRNICYRVRNDNETPREIRVVMALEEAEGAGVLNYAAAADRLDAGEVKADNYGVHIPGTGSYRVSIKLLDPDNHQVLTEKILPVD